MDDLDTGSRIRIYWDLLWSVLSPFIDSLPFHDSARNHVKIHRSIPLIRSALEWIGSNLEPQLYFPHLPKISQTVESDIHEVFYEVLEIFERFVDEDILDFEPGFQYVYFRQVRPASDSTDVTNKTFPRLSNLRVLPRSEAVVGTDDYPFCARDYINLDLSQESLSILYTRLETLNKTVSAAFSDILNESHPTPVEDSINAARQAQDFGKVAEELFRTLAGQMDAHCNRRREGFIRIAVGGGRHEPRVDMLLPTPARPLDPNECLQLDPTRDEQRSICKSVRRSKTRQRELVLHFKDNRLWETQKNLKRCAPLESRDPLGNYIWSSNAANLTNQSRAEIPVLLAHLMLYLYKTRWFQHLWDMDRLILYPGRGGSSRDPYPYLASDMSMNDGNGFIESISNLNEEDCDPLYRHTFISCFGLRLLEIESGRRFPPTDDDMDPEDDEKGTLPFLTLQRALDELQDTGQVEDGYFRIAKACLEFHSNLKQKRFRDVETSLRELVAIHNLIFSPLLQLLARKFKGAAVDLLESEFEARRAKINYAHSRIFKGYNPSRRRRKLQTKKSGLRNQLNTTRQTQNFQDDKRINAPLEPQQSIRRASDAIDSLPEAGVRATAASRLPINTALREPNERSPEHWFNGVDQLSGVLSASSAERNTSEYQRVKIAVLDTGISPDDPYAQDMEESLYRDFVNEEELGKRDDDGHGTDTVNLIFKVFEAPEIYVARVFERKMADENTPNLVAKALRWAQEQNVDIIVMALGFSRSHERIKKAIDAATAANILIFAAAGNWGGHDRVAFPARLDNVICMFSATPWNKNSHDINPPPYPWNTHNFAILGQEVNMHGPSQHPRILKGTSVSSAIAAGLAASLLDFSRQSVCRDQLRNIKGKREISAIFEDLSKDSKDGEYYCIAPWNLLKRAGDAPDRKAKRIKIRDHLSSILENCR
ncbi:hypothetical protein TWF281_011052 [Arthrobotrys megalospora]